MERRQFLQVTAAGAVALGLPGVSLWAGPATGLEALAEPDLLAIVGTRREVLEIGAAYRAAFPDEDVTDVLLATLRLPNEIAARIPATEMRTRLREQVRRDFAEGRTVQLEGWILSVTEARQCALLSRRMP